MPAAQTKTEDQSGDPAMDKQVSQEAKASKDKITYTVAKRRTLQVKGKARGPGAEITSDEIDEDEARKLMAGGFLVNPEAPEPKLAEGPSIQRTETDKK